MINRLMTSLKKRWRVLRDPEFRRFRQLIRQFNREQGRGTPTTFDGLTGDSVVFDLGGYEGEWANDMRRLYDCKVHVFEPHPLFAAALAERFSDDPNVTSHPYALGAAEGELTLSDDADASSAFSSSDTTVSGRIKPVQDVMAELGQPQVAAVKINIEYGEYDLLPALINTSLIRNFQTLVIQFHNYGPQDAEKRTKIREALAATHTCKWNYDFVWERWDILT